ncbi:hypothetical protein JM654_15290 [Microbacterium oxydans]|nr:hypothetical protein [Microbacterium oxydans]
MVEFINAEERAAGIIDFDYAELDDETAEMARPDAIEEKGYFLLPSQLYGTVQAGAARTKISTRRSRAVFKAVESTAVGSPSEDVYKGLFSGFDPNALVARRDG